MEHPILFITKLLETIGLGHFAHAYPHVTYTWLIMLLLIGLSLLAVRTVKMVPAGGQNFFEMVISGDQNFHIIFADAFEFSGLFVSLTFDDHLKLTADHASEKMFFFFLSDLSDNI